MTFTIPEEFDEFLNTISKEINNSLSYGKKAKGWGVDFDGRILLHIKRDINFDKNIFVILDLIDGECSGIEVYQEEEPDDYGFAFRGKFTDWKILLLSNSKETLSDGTFEFEGDLETWLTYKDVNYMIAGLAQQLPTEFETGSDR